MRVSASQASDEGSIPFTRSADSPKADAGKGTDGARARPSVLVSIPFTRSVRPPTADGTSTLLGDSAVAAASAGLDVLEHSHIYDLGRRTR